MQRTLLISTLVGLIAVLGATTVYAGPGRHGHGKHGHMMCPKMMEKLGLNAKQKEEIKTLRAEMKEETKATREQLNGLREQLHTLWAEDLPDETAILDLQRRMDPLRDQLRERKIQFKLDMLRVLTKEQRKTFREAKKGNGKGCPGRGRGHGKGHW